MIDRVELVMPDKQIRIARGAVDILGERVEPHQHGSFVRVRFVRSRGIEHDGAGKIIEREVQAWACLEQLANFVIGLIAPQRRIDFREDNLRHTQSKRAPDLAGDQLRNQRQDSLPRAPEFDHVEAEVVAFYNGGQGSALAQGHNITRRSNRS